MCKDDQRRQIGLSLLTPYVVRHCVAWESCAYLRSWGLSEWLLAVSGKGSPRLCLRTVVSVNEFKTLNTSSQEADDYPLQSPDVLGAAAARPGMGLERRQHAGSPTRVAELQHTLLYMVLGSTTGPSLLLAPSM